MQTTRPSLLVRLRRDDDDAAWIDFDRQYGELILRYCLCRGLQPSDAEDVRQRVLMGLVQVMPSFEYAPERGRFRGYLWRVVQNAIHRHFKCPNRSVITLDKEELALIAEDGAGEDDLWEREWMNHHVRRAMRFVRQTVGRRTMDVFDRLLAGRTVAQVASEMNMTREAVQKIRERVRDRLRDRIAIQLAEQER
jgi:RNA polymerase sigma-70 factor (ECF subfamily)